MLPEVGQAIGGKYRLTRLIGQGAMGCVFEATHEYLGNRVALKFLNPELVATPGLVARFLQEARLSASLRNAHVVQVSDVDQTPDGLPYFVMELLEGESLQQVLNRQQKVPIPTALEYAVQILNGLEIAHAQGIVHRDLKPDNVFVVPTAQGPLVKLLDFGIAKLRSIKEKERGLTRPGSVMGTLEYMAPEQAFSADAADHRADLYAVGVLLFEMIAGSRPVQAGDPQVMAAMVMAGQVRRLIDVVAGIPLSLSDVVGKALSGRIDERFRSASEMRGALLPFFTPTPRTLEAATYPSTFSAPGMSHVQPGTAFLAPIEQHVNRPAPTQPGTDPDMGMGISTTLPDQAGRTGTVLGGSPNYGPNYGPNYNSNVTDIGFEATAQMPPMQSMQLASVPAPPLAPPAMPLGASPPQRKSKSVVGVILGLVGALAILGLIALVVVAIVVFNDDDDDSDSDSSLVILPSNEAQQAPVEPDPIPAVTVPPPIDTPTTTKTTPTGVTQPPGTATGIVFPPIPDGGLNLPPFPSSLPSSLPPIQLPSAFPTFPIPGWSPSPSP